MDNYSVIEETNSIVIRFVLPKTIAADIRDGLKEDYTNIPKLNRDIFESFAEWLFEDASDSILKTLWNIHLDSSQIEDNESNEDESSEIEPW
jgi:hypothetical protein